MSIDPGLISGIALVVAVLSPILTSMINNHHEIKMHNRRFYEQHRAEVLENYVRDTGAVIAMGTPDNVVAYGKSFGEVFLYLPAPLHGNVESVHRMISDRKYSESRDLFISICKSLSESHPRSIKK